MFMKIKFLFVAFFILTKIAYGQSNYVFIDSSSVFMKNKKVFRFYHTFYSKDQVDSKSPYESMLDSTQFHFRELFPLDVLFKKSKSIVLPNSVISLNNLAKLLSDNPDIGIKIFGHTDKMGNAKKNLRLSKRRARVITNYLIRKGIGQERIVSIEGYGDNFPICDSPCDENRRVEFKFINLNRISKRTIKEGKG